MNRFGFLIDNIKPLRTSSSVFDKLPCMTEQEKMSFGTTSSFGSLAKEAMETSHRENISLKEAWKKVKGTSKKSSMAHSIKEHIKGP